MALAATRASNLRLAENSFGLCIQIASEDHDPEGLVHAHGHQKPHHQPQNSLSTPTGVAESMMNHAVMAFIIKSHQRHSTSLSLSLYTISQELSQPPPESSTPQIHHPPIHPSPLFLPPPPTPSLYACMNVGTVYAGVYMCVCVLSSNQPVRMEESECPLAPGVTPVFPANGTIGTRQKSHNTKKKR